MTSYPGWDLRSIYEAPKTDLMEAEAFYIAFARLHNIDGHEVLCILTPPKHRRANSDGVLLNSAVLIVKKSDIQGLVVNTSLRIDGTLYLIGHITTVCSDIIRLELEAAE